MLVNKVPAILYKVFLANIILSDKMVVSVFDSGHF